MPPAEIHLTSAACSAVIGETAVLGYASRGQPNCAGDDRNHALRSNLRQHKIVILRYDFLRRVNLSLHLALKNPVG